MRVLVQWAQRTPRDWQETTAAGFRALPSRPNPNDLPSRPVPDDQAGWIVDINCQGVLFRGHDHYAVEEIEDGARITVWSDSVPPQDREAQVWTVLNLAPDQRFGAALNTRQSRVVYAASRAMQRWQALGPVENTELRPWSEFVVPPVERTRHGLTLPDELYARHLERQSHRGWREWA